ncbi:unnamed protein product [Wickerhamomyces anomalus]
MLPIGFKRSSPSLLKNIVRLNKSIKPSVLELKVGQIRECNKHPDADKLYVSKIFTSDAEDATPLTVCSGLVNFVDREELLGRRVVLLTNLKPSKMRGIKSEAMILASENDDASKVEVVHPPLSSAVGELLHFKPFVPEGKPTRLKIKDLGRNPNQIVDRQ